MVGCQLCQKKEIKLINYLKTALVCLWVCVGVDENRSVMQWCK